MTCETEEEFESLVDSLMDVVGPASGAISGTPWEATPDDQPQGTGGPAAPSKGSERGFDSPPGVYVADERLVQVVQDGWLDDWLASEPEASVRRRFAILGIPEPSIE